MSNLIRINDEIISSDSFVNLLKLNGRFDELIDDVVKERLAVHSAKRLGIEIPPETVQKRSDQLRRVNGLHRAAEMNRHLEALKVSADEYESWVTDMLYYEQMMERVLSDEAVGEYFRLNSPKFDSVEVSHIVVESQGVAREIAAILQEEPERFAEFAREHSIDETAENGGYIGRVLRGAMQRDAEAKIFHAEEGAVLGPFPSSDGTCFEIFRVNARSPGEFDDETKTRIRRILKEEWLANQAGEHRIEVL